MSQSQEKPASKAFAVGDLGAFLLIVILSFIVLLTQNPSSVLPRTTLYFDAAHYLETCKRMHDACISFFSAGFSISRAGLDSLAYYLYLDGPVLPGAAMVMFFCLHKAPALSEWASLVGMQCLFQAGTAGCVFLIAKQLLKSRLLSALTAGLWTFYPSTLTSCNTYLTEPLACLLAVGMLYFLSGFARPVQNNDADSKLARVAEEPLLSDSEHLHAEAVAAEPFLLSDTKHLRAEAAAADAAAETESEAITLTKCLLAGIFWALFCLLKPALAPAAIVLVLLWLSSPILASSSGIFTFKFFSFNKIALCRTIALIVGIALIIGPWIAFGFAARGQLMLLPTRRPVYNITTGCNVEGDGWGCYPTHPVALMYDDNDSPAAVFYGLVKEHPAELINLSLRKITRLWNLPWNDYRYTICGLGFKQQALWQLVLLGLGLSGLVLLWAKCFGDSISKKQKLIGLSLIALIGGHLIYLPFEGISRYGFTGMPFFILAAGYFLECLLIQRSKLPLLAALLTVLVLGIVSVRIDLLPFLQILTKHIHLTLILFALWRTALVIAWALLMWGLFSLQKKGERNALIAALAALVILADAISFAFAQSNREAHTWSSTLKNGSSAEREIFVDDKSLAGADWALLIADGDQRLPDTKVSLNGNSVDEPFLSLYQFDSQLYELEDWLNQFASLTRKAPDSVRRWKAVRLPLTGLKPGFNSLRLQAPDKSGATVYGDYLQALDGRHFLLPLQAEVSPGKFFNDSDDVFDSRIMQSTFCTPAQSHNTLIREGKRNKADLSTAPGVQSGEYRIYLLLGYSHQPQLKGKDGTILSAAAVKTQSSTKAEKSLTLDSSAPLGAHFDLEIPANCLSDSHFQVTVEGELPNRAPSSFSVAGMLSQNGGALSSVLPGTPQLIQSGSSATFKVSSQLPCTAVTAGSRDAANTKIAPHLRIELKPIAQSTVINNLRITVKALHNPLFKDHSIRYF